MYLPLAELVDLGGRGEAAERVEGRAEAEQEVGVIGAGRRGGAQGEGGAVVPRGLCVLPRLPRDVSLLRQNPHAQQRGPGRRRRTLDALSGPPDGLECLLPPVLLHFHLWKM